MATFILIHGAFAGGWSWDSMRAAMKATGHTLITPDLPSQGEDQTPLSEVTLEAYANQVVEVLDAQPAPVILGGHSLGGISISQAAEYRPNKISKLVYIAAFLLPDGCSPKNFWENAGVPSPVMAHCDVTDDGVITYKKTHLAEQIYNCSPSAAIKQAMERQRPMARKPLVTPLQLSDANFGRIPRIYVDTLQDKVIPIEFQRQMMAALPCDKVVTLDTDHMPMASTPEQLVRELVALV